MCGRFTLQTPAERIAEMFLDFVGPLELPLLKPRYNVAPTQMSLCVRENQDGVNEACELRWGLVPFWSKELKIGAKMINARSETVATKPAFRSAFKSKRCLILTDGFFEWKAMDGGKQPYYITLKNHDPFCMAGLWESWTDNETEQRVESFTVLTTQANEIMEPLHDRMPVILDPEQYSMWLDTSFEDRNTLEGLLDSYPSEEMQTIAVSRVVNKVGNDSIECIEPVKVQRGLLDL